MKAAALVNRNWTEANSEKKDDSNFKMVHTLGDIEQYGTHRQKFYQASDFHPDEGCDWLQKDVMITAERRTDSQGYSKGQGGG